MKAPFSVQTAEQSSGYLFWKVSALWQRGIRELLEPLDLTHTQFVLLASLRWLGSSNQVDLSRHTGCDVMTVSAVVRTLAAKGRIEREEDERDKRAKILRITAKGRAVVDKAVPLVEAFDRRFFSDSLAGQYGKFLSALQKLTEQTPPL
jgi:DNA-binding MarR family transcriptional regulator